MAETVIKKNESILPFFGDGMTIIGGLDPLGNTSDSTFQMILPGLNNVTALTVFTAGYLINIANGLEVPTQLITGTLSEKQNILLPWLLNLIQRIPKVYPVAYTQVGVKRKQYCY